MMRRWCVLIVMAAPLLLDAQRGPAHPRILLTRAEGRGIAAAARTAPLLASSLAAARAVVDAAVAAPIETPPP
nr:hypothetical protein [Gemmatimonadaceae bacterium]